MRTLFATALSFVTPVAAQALVTMTDSGTVFNYTSYAAATNSVAGLGNFRTAGAASTDQVYQNWWYYCVQGDLTGSAFNTSNTQATATPSADGRSAVLQWIDVDARGFAATLEHTVYATSATTGVSTQAMTLTNSSAGPLTMMVYCYADCDVAGTAGADVSVAVPGGIKVTDNTTMQELYFMAEGGALSESLAYVTLRNNILGQAFYQPTGTLTFGPGDWTGVHAWNVTLQPSQSITLRALISTAPVASPRVAATSTFGTAKAGTNGTSSWGTARPFSSSTLNLRLDGGFTGSAPVLFLGTPVPSGLAVPPFGTLYVNVLATVSMPPFGTGPGFSSTLPLPIPALVGGAVSAQAFWLDPAASASLAHSDGLTLQFGSF